MHNDWLPLSRLGRLMISLALAFVLVLWLQPYVDRWWSMRHVEPRAVQARGDLAGDEQANIQIFEKLSPSVVYITTLKRVVNPWTRNVTQVPRGTGSGMIWDDQGHVVTNYHVIQGSGVAQVTLSDQRSYRAALVGASQQHDLAVLRINVTFDRPPPIPIGTSEDLRVGQKVLAIGNPFGLDRTLTTGIISALDRTIQDDEGGNTIEHLIQTDAAINPGNSGGPLIDSAGRLIGINTAIYSPSGAYAGIGFAVPVDTVNRVVPKLIASGRYVTPSIGIKADDDLSAALTRETGVRGVLVLQVVEGSPAQRAGLRETRVTTEGGVIIGDIIQAVDGKPVKRIGEILALLEQKRVGDEVRLSLHRDGKTIELKVQLEARAS